MSPMRILRRCKLFSAAVAVLVAGVLTSCGATPAATPSPPASRLPSASPGQPVPASAAATARRLVSGSEAEQHAAVSPALAAVLPQGAMFPAGSTIALKAGSWHQAGGYANATGTLSEPGKSPQPVELGFASSTGTWLVTFEEPLS